MLQSPGHSPLHLSSPSPSSASQFPPPNPNSGPSSSSQHHRAAAVLDEDTYVEALEKIIERDYFPDISKLRDRLDWLEAIKTGDPVQIRDAQLKIIERRAGKKVTSTTSNPLDSSRTSVSLGSTFVRNFTPLDEFDGKTPLTPKFSAGEGGGGGDGGASWAVDTSIGLDQFLSRYTSEDNHNLRQQQQQMLHSLCQRPSSSGSTRPIYGFF